MIWRIFNCCPSIYVYKLLFYTRIYNPMKKKNISKQLVYFDLIKQFLTQFVYESLIIFTRPKPIEFDMTNKNACNRLMYIGLTNYVASALLSSYSKNKTFLNDAFVMYKAAIMFHLSILLLFQNLIHGTNTKKLRNAASNVISMYRVPTAFEANFLDSYRKFVNSLITFNALTQAYIYIHTYTTHTHSVK